MRPTFIYGLAFALQEPRSRASVRRAERVPMLIWRSLAPSLIAAAAKALAARSAQGVAEPPRVTPLQPSVPAEKSR